MPDAYLVAIRCPQCGAETDFPEGASALRCAYCGVTLRVLGANRGGRARFVMLPTVRAEGLAAVLETHARETGRRLESIEWRALLLAPFWRARGMALRWVYTRPGGPSLSDIRASTVPTGAPAGPGTRRPSAPASPAPAPRPPVTRAEAEEDARPGVLATAASALTRLVFGGRTRRGDLAFERLLDAGGTARDTGSGEAPAGPAHDERRFESRHVDVSFPAFTGMDLGLASLGVRPAARPLRVLAPDAVPGDARLLPLDLDAEAALDRSAGYAFAEAEGAQAADTVIERRVAVTSTLSAIYFPFWAASAMLAGRERLVVVDAVAGSVVREAEPSETWFADLSTRTPPPLQAASLGFLPLKCPECAADLPLEASAVVHLCTGCGRAFAEGADRLVRVDYDALPARGDAVYLPYWRFEAAISVDGQRLARAAEMPRLVRPVGWPAPPAPSSEADRPAALFVPAFECRALGVLERLASALARLQPRVGGEPPVEGAAPIPLSPAPRAVGASLYEADARALADLFLLGAVPGSGPAARRRIASLSVGLGEGRLVWLPTLDRGSYLEDRLTAVSLPKASLGWAADGAGRPRS